MTAGQRLEHDWFDGVIPEGVQIHPRAWVDTTFGLVRIDACHDPALELAEGAGAYDGTSFEIGSHGHVSVGPFSCLNATRVICNREVRIGAHCLVSWQVVISDSDIGPGVSPAAHHVALERASADPLRRLPPLAPPRPVVIEDGAWIGFGSVILPGVTIGRGSVVGAKSVVDRDVPPGVIVAGNPLRVVRTLDVPPEPVTRQPIET